MQFFGWREFDGSGDLCPCLAKLQPPLIRITVPAHPHQCSCPSLSNYVLIVSVFGLEQVPPLSQWSVKCFRGYLLWLIQLQALNSSCSDINGCTWWDQDWVETVSPDINISAIFAGIERNNTLDLLLSDVPTLSCSAREQQIWKIISGEILNLSLNAKFCISKNMAHFLYVFRTGPCF